MNSNNWYVITGAPSAGKTTIIELLEKEGYMVVREVARKHIDQEIEKGRTISQIRQNEPLFQEEVLKMKIETEKELLPETVIFFDRGIPDSDAYYKLHNKKNDPFLSKAMKNCSYKKVFLLDFLHMDNDYARTETKEEQQKIHNLLKESYKKTKIPFIEVPKMESNERLDFILNNL